MDLFLVKLAYNYGVRLALNQVKEAAIWDKMLRAGELGAEEVRRILPNNVSHTATKAKAITRQAIAGPSKNFDDKLRAFRRYTSPSSVELSAWGKPGTVPLTERLRTGAAITPKIQTGAPAVPQKVQSISEILSSSSPFSRGWETVAPGTPNASYDEMVDAWVRSKRPKQ